MVPYLPRDSKVDAVDQELQRHQRVLVELRDKLRNEQERIKKYADTKGKFWEFHEGELVWLNLQPYRQKSVNN